MKCWFGAASRRGPRLHHCLQRLLSPSATLVTPTRCPAPVQLAHCLAPPSPTLDPELQESLVSEPPPLNLVPSFLSSSVRLSFIDASRPSFPDPNRHQLIVTFFQCVYKLTLSPFPFNIIVYIFPVFFISQYLGQK